MFMLQNCINFQFLHKSFTAIHMPYMGFIGPPHFSTIARLLGYQNIALILKELINIIKSLVSIPLWVEIEAHRYL